MGRDDFTKATIDTLAKRVGYRCSNPQCRALTSGPHTDKSRSVNVGVAAHITAASLGGPRFDESIRAEGRKSPANGIWLCQKCAKLIDSDTARSPVDLLVQWKSEAERAARSEVESRGERSTGRNLFFVPHRRNPYFQGRDEELQQLHAKLTDRQRAVLGQAISGLGGIGKTQTALEYAYRYRKQYQAILWVQAESQERIVSGFAGIANRLELPHDPANTQDAVRATQAWLESEASWLLILDNADQPEVVDRFLPSDCDGYVLLTSRVRDFALLGIDPLTLRVLPIGEAKTFLSRRTRRNLADPAELQAATVLAEELDGLPLALEQAAAYIVATEVSFTRYVELYRKQPLAMLEKHGPVTGRYPKSVATTWAINIEQLGEAEREVLRFSAFLSPDGIPLELRVPSGICG